MITVADVEDACGGIDIQRADTAVRKVVDMNTVARRCLCFCEDGVGRFDEVEAEPARAVNTWHTENDGIRFALDTP